MAVLLKDALRPNLLQTLEGQPALIHCGPFGNIATEDSSILADRLGLQRSDIVITEAGFGADLGFERFVNVKCRTSDLAAGRGGRRGDGASAQGAFGTLHGLRRQAPAS